MATALGPGETVEAVTFPLAKAGAGPARREIGGREDDFPTVAVAAVADADRTRIRDVRAGHRCRCTGYVPIVAAALAARDRLARERDHA